MTTIRVVQAKCRRCNGSGTVDSRVHGGACFACDGTGHPATAAEIAARVDRLARHAALYAAAKAADAALRASEEHHRTDLAIMESTDPAAYEAALSAVTL